MIVDRFYNQAKSRYFKDDGCDDAPEFHVLARLLRSVHADALKGYLRLLNPVTFIEGKPEGPLYKAVAHALGLVRDQMTRDVAELEARNRGTEPNVPLLTAEGWEPPFQV